MRPLVLLPLLLAATLAASAATPAADNVTVFRCVDAKGAVSLQDKPCPTTAQASSRLEMVRPKDAPPRPRTEAAAEPPPEPVDAEPWEFAPRREPPPPMYVCTSYDGIVRESENYDPNPRCEPLGLYWPGQLTPEEAGACHWVEDSCVRLSDAETCERWRAHRKVAKSEALHADSSTMAYKRSELRRIEQIIATHCD